MPRSRRDLENSRDLLRNAVKTITREIAKIEQELSDLDEPAKLNEDFFWREVAPIVANHPNGIEGSRAWRLLTAGGYLIPQANFRTFLSRYKDRGLLSRNDTNPPRWSLSASAHETLRTLEEKQKK